jgi:hypothetical protein
MNFILSSHNSAMWLQLSSINKLKFVMIISGFGSSFAMSVDPCSLLAGIDSESIDHVDLHNPNCLVKTVRISVQSRPYYRR